MLTTLVAAPAPKVIVCVATVRPAAVKVIVYEPDGPVMPRPLNVATPLMALAAAVPFRVPPEPAVNETVIDDPLEIVKLFAS